MEDNKIASVFRRNFTSCDYCPNHRILKERKGYHLRHLYNYLRIRPVSLILLFDPAHTLSFIQLCFKPGKQLDDNTISPLYISFWWTYSRFRADFKWLYPKRRHRQKRSGYRAVIMPFGRFILIVKSRFMKCFGGLPGG